MTNSTSLIERINMKAIVGRADTTLLNNISGTSSWDEIAQGWNLHHKLGEVLFAATYEKAVTERLNKDEIVKKLRYHGCSIGDAYIYRKLEFYDFKLELRNFDPGQSNLKIPETERQYRHLDGDTAAEKAQQFTEIAEATGKDPTGEEVRAWNKAKDDLIKKQKERMAAQTTVKDGEFEGIPKDHIVRNRVIIFPEEQKEFEKYFMTKYPKLKKPKVNFLELEALRKTVIDDMAVCAADWKTMRKRVAKCFHPDTGGTDKEFAFFKLIDKLMDNLTKAFEAAEYELIVAESKKAWLREQYKTI